jgi:hypothetical protein
VHVVYPLTEEELARAVLPRDPVGLFTEAAVHAGVIRDGDKLDDSLMELCQRVVSISCAIGDNYRISEEPRKKVGDVIRAHLYLP